MIITSHGKQCVKMQFGDTIIAYNPISKKSKSGVKPAKFGATIALVSSQHPDFNGIENVTHGDKVPFVIDGPGQYEIHDVYVEGVLTDTTLGGKSFVNTIYTLSLDGMKVLFIGNLDDVKNLSGDAREEIGDADIVFISLTTDMDPVKAYKFASSFVPGIIIPLDYEKAVLGKFLKEAGTDKVKPIDKLTLKKKDLNGKEAEVVLLEE